MTMKPLQIPEVEDKWSRENFQRVQDFVNDEPIFKGAWKFFSITVTAVTTRRAYSHNLGFQPKDVITLSVSGGYDVVWDYDSFTPTQIVFSTSGPCTIRAFIGRYEEVT